MRHGIKHRKLGRKNKHRLALIRNQCRALFIFEKITTTLPKAKETRSLAERLIQFAKRGDLSARRHIYRFVPDHKLVKIICDEIAPRFVNRNGGYTRIYRLGPRLGDGAEMAVLQLTETSKPEDLERRRKLIERRQVTAESPKKTKTSKARKESKDDTVKKGKSKTDKDKNKK